MNRCFVVGSTLNSVFFILVLLWLVYYEMPAIDLFALYCELLPVKVPVHFISL